MDIVNPVETSITDESFSTINFANMSKSCNVNINIKEVMYDNGSKYYYIVYTNEFKNNNLIEDTINKSHPFFDNDDLIEHLDGDIIVKNEMTDSMVKYLIMDKDELQTKIGNTDTNYYKSVIMKTITL